MRGEVLGVRCASSDCAHKELCKELSLDRRSEECLYTSSSAAAEGCRISFRLRLKRALKAQKGSWMRFAHLALETWT